MTRGRREDDRFFYEHIVLNVESGVFSLISFNCRVFFFFVFFFSVSDLIGHSQSVKNDARFVDSARTLDGKRIVSIRRPVFRHGKISGNPFSRRTFVLDDRTRRIKWSNVASQTDVLSGTIRLWTLYVQREGRCILFSNVCPDCGDPSLPGRSFDSPEQRATGLHSIRREWWTLYKVSMNYRIDIILSSIFKIWDNSGDSQGGVDSLANFLPRSVRRDILKNDRFIFRRFTISLLIAVCLFVY